MALPSHLTDVVQPLDVSVFKPFKAALKKGQRDWRAKNRGKSIIPSLYVKCVTESWMQCGTPSVIMSGFRKARISPFFPEIFLASLDPCRLAYQAPPPSAAEPAAEPAAEAVLPSLEASTQRVEKVDFQCQATRRAINMATRHDPWNMRLGGFVASQCFREAAANYEKEQERNKEKPAARCQAGRVRPRVLPQHQQQRAKRVRRQDPPQIDSAVVRADPEPPAPPPPPPGRGTQFRLRWRLCPHSLCVILLKLLRTSVREVCASTPQSHGNKKTATQFCRLAACVSAWVPQGKVRMQGRH